MGVLVGLGDPGNEFPGLWWVWLGLIGWFEIGLLVVDSSAPSGRICFCRVFPRVARCL